jgi:hypothetical protein
MPAVNIPGVGRVHFPEGTSVEDMQSAALELSSGVGLDPNTGAYNEDLARIDRAMSGTAPGDSGAERPYRFTVPGMGGRGFSVGGPIGKAANWANNVREEDSMPVVGATIGSLAFPPSAAAAAGPLLGRLASQFGPSVLASGAGGAMGGGAAESLKPESTARSIATEAAKSGAAMAGAEVAGLGLGSLANRVIAPRLTFMDPGKPIREAASSFTRKTAEHLKPLAEKVGKVVNRNVGDDPVSFLGRVAADKRLVAKLEKVLTAKQLRSFLRFANSPLGSEAVEAAAVPLATAIGGLPAGAAVWAAKSILSPGPAARYLSRTQLPSTAVRTVGRQLATTPMRTGGGF